MPKMNQDDRRSSRPDEPEDCPDWEVNEPETASSGPPEPYPPELEELEEGEESYRVLTEEELEELAGETEAGLDYFNRYIAGDR